MTGREQVLAHRRWRAPREDGAALIDPPLDAAAGLVQANGALRQSYRAEILGRPLADLASAARGELLALAHGYTAAYRDVPPVGDPKAPILLAGHQPELFHPGVWFKSFVLSTLGKRLNVAAVNLLIDNDTLRAASIRVPCGVIDQPRIEQVPLDAPSDEVPFEERGIRDAGCFDSFGERAAAIIAPLVAGPLLTDLWPLATSAARRIGNLGRSLAEARHRLEGELGLATLEVPLSLVCESDSFRWFAAGLLEGLPKLREIYNASLAEYRRENKIRSRSHPVPDLAAEQGYLEAPFWFWTRDSPHRRRLFVFHHADRLEVTDRDRVRFDLPLSGAGAVEALRRQTAAGVRIRPRALVTTMYARLLLGDLFVHGIGGGKYDQLTDVIMARYFDLRPPAFLTATATVRLPVERPTETLDDLLRLSKTERDMTFHPERFVPPALVDSNLQVRQLMAEKKRWLAAEVPPGDLQRRHEGIEQVNQAFQPFLAEQRREIAGERERLGTRLRAATLLGSREFAYCLFPREFVVPLLERLAK